ncbi:MAG: hypothetical protein AAB693_00135 [Patescibacteria group bacterium]
MKENYSEENIDNLLKEKKIELSKAKFSLLEYLKENSLPGLAGKLEADFNIKADNHGINEINTLADILNNLIEEICMDNNVQENYVYDSNSGILRRRSNNLDMYSLREPSRWVLFYLKSLDQEINKIKYNTKINEKIDSVFDWINKELNYCIKEKTEDLKKLKESRELRSYLKKEPRKTELKII